VFRHFIPTDDAASVLEVLMGHELGEDVRIAVGDDGHARGGALVRGVEVFYSPNISRLSYGTLSFVLGLVAQQFDIEIFWDETDC
jgi:hypothetical protein